MKKQAVLSLSGGMDSSTLLLHLLANDYEVTDRKSTRLNSSH